MKFHLNWLLGCREEALSNTKKNVFFTPNNIYNKSTVDDFENIYVTKGTKVERTDIIREITL